MKPKIFYDASICIDASRGHILPSEWTWVCKIISRDYKYYISPLAVDELIRGIHRGLPNEFLRNRRALELLYPSHAKTFLPYPADFVLTQVFGDRTRRRIPQTAFAALIKAFLHSKSAEELTRKQVWRGKRDTGLSELLARSHWYSNAQSAYAKDYSSSRHAVTEFPEEVWVRMTLEHYRQPDTTENRALVRESHSANLLAVKFGWEARKNKHYDFFKHSSDLVDAQQLAYLADPNMHFITNDRKLKTRIATSPQSSRVWSWAEVVGILQIKGT